MRRAGKRAVAIEPDGATVKGAEVCRSLAEAGPVDGVVLLPPAPWNDAAAAFTADALHQAREQGVTALWIYTAGDVAPAVALATRAGFDPTAGQCPCLYIPAAGFPHNLHRWIAQRLGQW